jgi:hypothetical protein
LKFAIEDTDFPQLGNTCMQSVQDHELRAIKESFKNTAYKVVKDTYDVCKTTLLTKAILKFAFPDYFLPHK